MNEKKKDKLNWSIVPQNLRYLIPFAEKYGYYQFDHIVIDYLFNEMTTEDANELRSIGPKIDSDCHEIEAWLDQYNMTKHREAALIYFARLLLGTAIDTGSL